MEATVLQPRPATPAARGRPSPARDTAPSPALAGHLAPPPEEGIRDRGDLGGSPASAGESLGGARGRGPLELQVEQGRREKAPGVGWSSLAPGAHKLEAWAGT